MNLQATTHQDQIFLKFPSRKQNYATPSRKHNFSFTEAT